MIVTEMVDIKAGVIITQWLCDIMMMSYFESQSIGGKGFMANQ